MAASRICGVRNLGSSRYRRQYIHTYTRSTHAQGTHGGACELVNHHREPPTLSRSSRGAHTRQMPGETPGNVCNLRRPATVPHLQRCFPPAWSSTVRRCGTVPHVDYKTWHVLSLVLLYSHRALFFCHRQLIIKENLLVKIRFEVFAGGAITSVAHLWIHRCTGETLGGEVRD